jgi:CBS domain-containing membrane protein
MSTLHVRDLMTSTVVSVGARESISHVLSMMDERRIRHVPVVDEQRTVVGVVSQRDVLQRALFQHSGTVNDIMSWHIETIGPDDDISVAARIMLDHKYGCLPVVEHGRLAGILTEADFVRHMAAHPGESLT